MYSFQNVLVNLSHPQVQYMWHGELLLAYYIMFLYVPNMQLYKKIQIIKIPPPPQKNPLPAFYIILCL